MYRYKRLLVGLDFSERDQAVLKIASLFSQLAQSEKIYFCHVEKSLDLPVEIQKDHSEFLEPIDEFAKDKMQELINDYYKGPKNIDIKCEVTEGSRLVELLHLSVRKEIDLIIVGKKLDPDAGSIPEKLARKSPCSVLIVPNNTAPNIERILVPLDFSKHSIEAMEIAIRYASASKQSTIYGIHVYSLPSGYYKTGKSEEEFAKAMENNAKKEFEKFLDKINLKGIELNCNFVLNYKPAKAIQKEIERVDAHLVIVGARGRSDLTSILLGSITEKLIHRLKVPIIAAKEKGESLHLLDWLKQITRQEE